MLHANFQTYSMIITLIIHISSCISWVSVFQSFHTRISYQYAMNYSCVTFPEAEPLHSLHNHPPPSRLIIHRFSFISSLSNIRYLTTTSQHTTLESYPAFLPSAPLASQCFPRAPAHSTLFQRPCEVFPQKQMQA